MGNANITTSIVAWNKLKKRSFIEKNKLYFKEGIIYEDNLWIYYLQKYLSEVARVSDVTYYYRKYDSICPSSYLAIRNSFKYSLITLKDVYDILPFDFCLCGGDWIDFGDTQMIAQNKLLFADNYMKTNFENYYKLMGNHDTNYQGIVSENDSSRGDLTREFINKIYFSETGSSYYYFDKRDTRFMMFDSGIDWDTTIDEHRKSQIQWFVTTLKNNTMKHIIIGIHMFYIKDITPFSKAIVSISEAFNSRSTVNIDDEKYDFSDSNGLIHLILSGHNHKDYNDNVKSIPVVGTRKYMKNNTPNFDICLLNYDEGFFEMFRVGDGKNRKIKLFVK